jgi:FKBP-type peptidyl-prolyl cis-trans isomerase SlyD
VSAILTTVANGKVVYFHYTLTNPEGEVLDQSEAETPLAYLHGAGNIVPGLETALLGRHVGDEFVAIVSPEEGYGEHDGEEPQEVPRDAFPDDMELEPGMPVFGETPDGDHVALWVVEVDDETVKLDANHPLAGVTLHFKVKITEVREATEEEQVHGHPHGFDGAEHDEDDGWDDEEELEDEDFEDEDEDEDGEEDVGEDETPRDN